MSSVAARVAGFILASSLSDRVGSMCPEDANGGVQRGLNSFVKGRSLEGPQPTPPLCFQFKVPLPSPCLVTIRMMRRSAPLARIEQVAHGIAKQVRPEYDETDRQAWEDHQPGRG